MFNRWLKVVKIRSLILTLGILSVLVTLGSSFYASYEVQRQLLIDNTLESNRVYAAKLATVAGAFIKTSLGHLGYSAALLGEQMDNAALLKREAQRLHLQSKQFNSVVIVDHKGYVIASSPSVMADKKLQVTSRLSRQSLDAKAPLVADPFMSPAGNYVVSLSQPIFAADGSYLGYISGNIHLEAENNILNTLLGTHHYKDGSYLYVVDRQRTLIYHPDTTRVGEVVTVNPAVNDVVTGQSGAHPTMNSKGIEMLAGFAAVEQAGWGVIAQRPLHATLAPLNGHIVNVIIKSTPLALLTLLAIWLATTFISRPLWYLARSSSPIDPTPEQDIKNINAWYFEAHQLKKAIMKNMRLLNERISQLYSDTQTDPLTGLLNRRGMQYVLEQYELENKPFAVIMFDLDHFKQINDTYGHDVGDKVIMAFADQLRAVERTQDALCRSGGEEFIVILPNTSQETAFSLAEQFREQFSQVAMPTQAPVTVSIGVSYWPGAPTTIHSILKKVDKALYQAKQHGRNNTVNA